MKRIFNVLAQKWPEYLLEILVITIGILGAFALNSWNQQRLERKEEIEILLSVKKDLQNVIKEFEFLNGIRDSVLTGAEGIFRLTQTDQIEKEEMNGFLGLTMYRPTFNNKMGAINLLFSSGKINLIQSDSIKEKLLALPGAIDDMVEEEVYATEVFQTQYYPVLAKYIFIQDIVKYAFGTSFFGAIVQEDMYNAAAMESDHTSLLLDMEFLNHLRMRASHMQITNGETRELIKLMDDIIQLIDQEVKK